MITALDGSACSRARHISKRPSEKGVCPRAAKHPLFGSLRRVLDFHVVYGKVKKGSEFVKITTVRTWSDDDAARNPKPRSTSDDARPPCNCAYGRTLYRLMTSLHIRSGLSVIDRLTMGGLQTGRFPEANLEIRRATNSANVRTTGIRLMNALVEGTTEAATLYAR